MDKRIRPTFQRPLILSGWPPLWFTIPFVCVAAALVTMSPEIYALAANDDKSKATQLRETSEAPPLPARVPSWEGLRDIRVSVGEWKTKDGKEYFERLGILSPEKPFACQLNVGHAFGLVTKDAKGEFRDVREYLDDLYETQIQLQFDSSAEGTPGPVLEIQTDKMVLEEIFRIPGEYRMSGRLRLRLARGTEVRTWVLPIANGRCLVGTKSELK